MIPRLVLAIALISTPSIAQTTYTTTQDSCIGKAFQWCEIPVSEVPSNGDTSIIIDNSQYGGVLYFRLPSQVIEAHDGVYSGFGGNPDGSKNDFYGMALFESKDGLVVGTFYYHATYVSRCSGRGCGGVLGWHYRILAGSMVKES